MSWSPKIWTIFVERVKNHVSYPITKPDLVKEFMMVPEFNESQREWIKQTLPDGLYESPSEVIKSLEM